MSLSRRIFKSRLKFCQRNQEQIQLDIIATQHSTRQFGKFWKSTKKLSGRADLPVSVDGSSDSGNVANTFKDYFAPYCPSPEVSVTFINKIYDKLK